MSSCNNLVKFVNLTKLLHELIYDTLPGVELSDVERGRDFLNSCLEREDIQLINCFSNDKWITPYYKKVKDSHKKFLFEGPGKDPGAFPKSGQNAFYSMTD